MAKVPPVDDSPVKRPRLPAPSRTAYTGPPSAETIANAASYGIQIGNFGLVQIRVWRDQEAFLKAFRVSGMKGLCAIRAGVHRDTVRLWERGNMHNFVPRLADAMEVYVDLVDENLTALAFETKHPLASIAILNAYRPERYKRETVVADNRTVEALNDIKKLMVAEAERRALVAGDGVQGEGAKALEVIEGKARVIEDE